MRRLLVSAAVLLAVTAGPAHAATKTYSTGNIDVPIGAGLDRSLTVRDRGPVSFVRVSFRITTPDTSGEVGLVPVMGWAWLAPCVVGIVVTGSTWRIRRAASPSR